MTPERKREHHFKKDRTWRDALQYALDEAMGERSKDPTLSRPEVRVVSVNESGNRFEAELRFVRGFLYCCCEPGCFLATYDAAWWRMFRDALAEVSDRDPPPFVVLLHGLVEEGARLRAHDAVGLPRASPGFTYAQPPMLEADARSL